MKVILIGIAGLFLLGAATPPKRSMRTIKLHGSVLVKSTDDCLELNRAMGTDYFEPVVTAMLLQGRAIFVPQAEIVAVDNEARRQAPKDWLKVSVNTADAKGVFWVPAGSLEGETSGEKTVAAYLIIVMERR